MHWLEFLDRLPKMAIIGAAVVWLLALAWIDYWTPPDLIFIVFYFLPIFLVAWFVGRTPGLVMASSCGLAWLLAHSFHPVAYSHPLVPFWNFGVEVAAFFAVSYLFSILRDSYEKEKQFARRDALTGLANRRLFIEIAHREIARGMRNRHPLTVAYVDVDNFKQINDRWGHSQGDTVLTFVGRTMQRNLREIDVVARMGGDEFALLLPDASPQEACAVMERIHQTLSQDVRDSGCPVTFSVGMITFLEMPVSVDVMIRKADSLMYSVKKKGKNTLLQHVVDSRPDGNGVVVQSSMLG